jgi:hypothetical protein
MLTCSHSWYKRGAEGGILMWPGTMAHALHVFREVRYEHFDVGYVDEVAGNSMAWLANGMDDEELKPGGHLTGFLDPCVWPTRNPVSQNSRQCTATSKRLSSRRTRR